MKPHLLFADRDHEDGELPSIVGDTERDLGLESVLDAMASGDSYLRDVARRAMLATPLSPAQVMHRQEVLRDCLAQPRVIRDLYDLATQAIDAKRRTHSWISISQPGSILRSSVAILRDLTGYLQAMHDLTATHRSGFHSTGFATFFDSIERDLDAAYLEQVRGHLSRLEFSGGVVLTARLGPGGTGADYVLREAAPAPWWSMFGDWMPHGHGFVYRLPPRDENGGRTLDRIQAHGINAVANAAAQSADHVLDFFHRLRFETAFYLGCVNLHHTLDMIGVTTCLPTPEPPESLALDCHGLVDIGLAVRTGLRPIGSDLAGDGKALIMMTGANQGGKSTLLRAVGLAQLMVNAGTFVCAQEMRASVSTGVFTHYRREEGGALRHGKFDDELHRMSRLVDRLRPGCLVLLDESFSSTTEREGSQVARDIVDAFVAAGIRVCMVTHLYTLSHGLAEQADPLHLFLRAQRDGDGHHSFRLVPGSPESTSHALDEYRKVFAEPLRVTARR